MNRSNHKMFLRVEITLKMVGKVELLLFCKGETLIRIDKKLNDLGSDGCGLETPFARMKIILKKGGKLEPFLFL